MAPIRVIIGIALLTTLDSSAQNIIEYRYWWDDDMSTLTNVPVVGAGTVTVNTVLPASLLGRGHHRVTVQFKDDNDKWGAPYTQLWKQQLQLAAWEYWFDDDITDRVTVTTPLATEQDIVASLDASSLTAGYHRVSVRSLTDNSEGSVPYTCHFIRMGGDLVKWQYWFNDDIAAAVDISLSPPTDLLELITAIDASGLPAGPNTVTWRSADAIEVWSPPVTYAFDAIVGITELPGLVQMTLFPNPAAQDLFLRLDQAKQMDVMIELVDHVGRVVWSQRSVQGPGSNVQAVDVSTLSSGAYQLRISNEDGTVTRPFIKY